MDSVAGERAGDTVDGDKFLQYWQETAGNHQNMMAWHGSETWQ